MPAKVSKSSMIIAMKMSSILFLVYFYFNFTLSIKKDETQDDMEIILNHHYLITNKFSNIEERKYKNKETKVDEKMNLINEDYEFKNIKCIQEAGLEEINPQALISCLENLTMLESQQSNSNGPNLDYLFQKSEVNNTQNNNGKSICEKEKDQCSEKNIFKKIVKFLKYKMKQQKKEKKISCETFINKHFKFANLFFVFMLGAFINTKGCVKIGAL